MDNKNAYLKLLRVQGGNFPNRSRYTIKVVDGKIKCPLSRDIYVGDTEHMTHFLQKRIGINQIDDIPDNVGEYDIHVVEMYVPYWLPYLLEQYSVSQFGAKGKKYPKLVDKTTPRKILSNKWKLE